MKPHRIAAFLLPVLVAAGVGISVASSPASANTDLCGYVKTELLSNTTTWWQNSGCVACQPGIGPGQIGFVPQANVQYYFCLQN